MDISLLKTFIEVNKTRNFARAADNLFVTSAAVSARIKLLESQIGVTLFVRHPGNIQLTTEGERLVPLADSMINTWARALQEVSLLPEMEARIHIGATASLWALSMQGSLVTLTEQLPDIAIQAEGHSSDNLARMIVDRTLDVGLLHDPVATTEFKSEKIGDMELVLCTTTPNVPLKKILGKGYIYVDWGTGFATFHADKVGPTRPGLSVNLANIAYGVLSEKEGAAFLPRSTVETTPHLSRVKGVPSYKRPVYACYRETNDRLDTIRQVVSQLRGLSI